MKRASPSSEIVLMRSTLRRAAELPPALVLLLALPLAVLDALEPLVATAEDGMATRLLGFPHVIAHTFAVFALLQPADEARPLLGPLGSAWSRLGSAIGVSFAASSFAALPPLVMLLLALLIGAGLPEASLATTLGLAAPAVVVLVIGLHRYCLVLPLLARWHRGGTDVLRHSARLVLASPATAMDALLIVLAIPFFVEIVALGAAAQLATGRVLIDLPLMLLPRALALAIQASALAAFHEWAEPF